MSQANHDHASALPTEIWLQIITHVPRATLHSLTKVNRALRQISLPVFLETLDLAPFRRRASHTLALRRGEDMSDRNAEWEALIQWRLHLAQTIPSAVRAVHLLPYHGSVEYVYPTQGFLERTVRSTLRSLVGLELNFVADRISLTTLQDHIENIFISIIPSLVNVHELHIRNDIQYHTPSINLRRCRSIDTAWASWASRLTLLAVDVSNAWDIDHWFPPPIDGNESTCYTLPLLRTYRVHFRAAEPVSNPGSNTFFIKHLGAGRGLTLCCLR
ncbi:hypothetical protein DL96DRAFT_238285 [Flagelloscypha sp. PMI_526]|nr:hypothetical protein DL96DRAFT_238285 [Flagelloscypha sp. PMI_526]